MGCAPREVVKLASTRLVGGAQDWWDECVYYYGQDEIDDMGWDDFVALFRD